MIETIPDTFRLSLTASQDLDDILYQIPAKKHTSTPSNNMLAY